MLPLTRGRLDPLRDALRARGQRPSIAMAVPAGSHELIEALQLVEEWGAFTEAMYLMMAADHRVLNVEREVLRGALAVLSHDRVRTRHMEAMLDAAARRYAAEGAERRFHKVMDALRESRAKAESAVIVAAAVAAADHRVAPEEHALLTRMCDELGVDEARATSLVSELERAIAEHEAGEAPGGSG